jgi:N-succinyldiaminopimelate aminotransferase
MNLDYLKHALTLAERHDFIIASDECYADLYDDPARPPPSLLSAAAALGLKDFARCMSFHSLSKRSSLPGLRSGLVAGSSALMAPFLLYRTYHGCAMSLPVQHASIAAWSDDAHVEENRRLYRRKFDRALPILAEAFDVERPAGGFYVWLDVRGDDTAFAAGLYAEQNVTVVPGSFLGRDSATGNPGAGRIRISLVAPEEECVQAVRRIRDYALHTAKN